MSGAFAADYFDGRSSRRHRVEVMVTETSLEIRGDQLAFTFPRAQAYPRPRVGRTPIRIDLPGGGLLVGDGREVGAALPIAPSAGLAHRLESHVAAVLVALAGIVVAMSLGYRHGIPWLAREAALRLPPEIEAEVAASALRFLDGTVFGPTAVQPQRRLRLEGHFRRLMAVEGIDGALHFRHGGMIGPNAMALGGGTVVVTDQLLEMLDDERVVAVLAHEIGHLGHRHAMRQVLQGSVVALVSAAVLGDVGSVAGFAAAIPTTLATSSYSREFEREADQRAYELLRGTGRPPGLLGATLETLEDQMRADVGARAREWAYLATHPPTEERVRAAKEAPWAPGAGGKP